jgi:hypothetical protein
MSNGPNSYNFSLASTNDKIQNPQPINKIIAFTRMIEFSTIPNCKILLVQPMIKKYYSTCSAETHGSYYSHA